MFNIIYKIIINISHISSNKLYYLSCELMPNLEIK